PSEGRESMCAGVLPGFGRVSAGGETLSGVWRQPQDGRDIGGELNGHDGCPDRKAGDANQRRHKTGGEDSRGPTHVDHVGGLASGLIDRLLRDARPRVDVNPARGRDLDVAKVEEVDRDDPAAW